MNLLFQKWLNFNFAHLLSAKILINTLDVSKVIRTLQPMRKKSNVCLCFHYH